MRDRKSMEMLLFTLIPLLALLVAFSASCGGKKKISSSPSPAVVNRVSGDAAASAEPFPSAASDRPGFFKAGAVREETIRVLLAENFGLLQVEGSQFGAKLKIEARPASITLLAVSEGLERRLACASGFRLLPSQGQLLKLEGKSYRGSLEVFINPLGVPVAVNELNIEDYLKSVVPNELGPSRFPFAEALKAQSVAARTFAISEKGSYASRGFDVFSDFRSQAYAGAASEQPLSSAAVEQTKGIIATYRNKPILALYSSTCGGRTEAFNEIFKGGPIDYLRGGSVCHDEDSPYHRWEESISISSIQPQLERLADVGALRELIPERRTRWGRIVQMRFVGEKGEKVLKGLEIRNALGLKSNLILKMQDTRDERKLLTRIQVKGGGWGHSVGLCQYGAIDLARRGSDYEQILKHYYQGVELAAY